MAFGPRPLRGDLLLPSAITQLPPPDHLSPEAREHWSDLVRALGPVGMLSEVDGPALAMLCENMADYWTLRQDIRSIRIADDAADDVRKDLMRLRTQCISAVSKLDARIRDWLTEMLLTPASRSRAQPSRAIPEEMPLDLSVLDADERAALREMLSKRGEQRVLN